MVHPRFEDIQVSCDYIRERYQMFVDADLAYREHHDKYEITIWGNYFWRVRLTLGISLGRGPVGFTNGFE